MISGHASSGHAFLLLKSCLDLLSVSLDMIICLAATDPREIEATRSVTIAKPVWALLLGRFLVRIVPHRSTPKVDHALPCRHHGKASTSQALLLAVLMRG